MATAMVQRSTSVVVKQSTKQELFNCAATELIDEAPEDFFEDVVLQKPQKRVTLVDAYSTEERHANEAAEGHTAAPGKSSLESQPTMSTADTNSSLVAGVEDGEGISSAGGKSDSGTDARQEAMNRRCDEVPLHSADSYFTSDIPLPKGIPVRELRELAEKNSRGAPEALYEFLFNENGWAPNGTHKGVVCERMEVEGNEWLGCRGKMNLGKAIDPLDIRDILGGRASHSSSPSSSSMATAHGAALSDSPTHFLFEPGSPLSPLPPAPLPLPPLVFSLHSATQHLGLWDLQLRGERERSEESRHPPLDPMTLRRESAAEDPFFRSPGSNPPRQQPDPSSPCEGAAREGQGGGGQEGGTEKGGRRRSRREREITERGRINEVPPPPPHVLISQKNFVLSVLSQPLFLEGLALQTVWHSRPPDPFGV
mmetsp:Transcript_12749/g.24822  ORF Transcript_12749/g.24822 Transcript_12749/m.24822 type:complete len:425 (-) Transcript_12749:257-1531(-)